MRIGKISKKAFSTISFALNQETFSLKGTLDFAIENDELSENISEEISALKRIASIANARKELYDCELSDDFYYANLLLTHIILCFFL